MHIFKRKIVYHPKVFPHYKITHCLTYNVRMLSFTISTNYKCCLQKQPRLLSYITISSLPRFAFFFYITILRRPCHCFTETVVPRTVLISKSHEQPPFTMAVISSIWSPTNSTPHYSIEYISWITSISIGHNCVEHHFVLLFVKLKCTEVMSLMVKCEFDSDVHNPSYCSGMDGVLQYLNVLAQYTVQKTRLDSDFWKFQVLFCLFKSTPLQYEGLWTFTVGWFIVKSKNLTFFWQPIGTTANVLSRA